MKLFRATGALLLASAVLVGCDESSDPGYTIDDFVGAWVASSFTYTDASNSVLAVDAIGDAGGAISITVTSGGAFTGSVNIPGLTINPSDGSTITVSVGGVIDLVDQEHIFIDFNAATEALGLFDDIDAVFTLSTSGNILTWTDNAASFDFPDNIDPRGAVDAVLVAVFDK